MHGRESTLLVGHAVRVRFANLVSATRSVTLGAPISATVILAEIAEELVRAVLADHPDHPDEKIVSLLAISVSHLEEHWDVQLELPLGLKDEARRPGTKKGMARWAADCAVDRIRDRFGWDAVGYASVALGISRSVPDECRKRPVTITGHGGKTRAPSALSPFAPAPKLRIGRSRSRRHA
jgi:DNA polymerase-4